MSPFCLTNTNKLFLSSERRNKSVDFYGRKPCLCSYERLGYAWILSYYFKNFILVAILAILAIILVNTARIILLDGLKSLLPFEESGQFRQGVEGADQDVAGCAVGLGVGVLQ